MYQSAMIISQITTVQNMINIMNERDLIEVNPTELRKISQIDISERRPYLSYKTLVYNRFLYTNLFATGSYRSVFLCL